MTQSDFSRKASEELFASLSSRRSFFKMSAGVAAGGAGILAAPALIAQAAPTSSVTEILTVARTAEQLAVTFYSNGVANAEELGLEGEQLDYIKSALIEEQIHLNFFKANGGGSLATTFSFPHGEETFQELEVFIETQQQLEGVFDSAFIAAVREFCELGNPRLAQIACQIAMVESEHRVLGRVIGKLRPADNWAYAPALLAHVADAPGVVAKAGYLSPRPENSYMYHAVSTVDPRIVNRTPVTVHP